MNIRGRGVLPWRDANGKRLVAQALGHVRAGGNGPCFEAPAPHLSGAAVLQLADDRDVDDHELVAVVRQFDAGLEGVDAKPATSAGRSIRSPTRCVGTNAVVIWAPPTRSAR